MKKTVCIIGKPNVGKSTIFNRLIGEKKAITLDTPGVTRDRIYGTVNYRDFSFYLIDTGGIQISADEISDSIKIQAEIGIYEADKIIFVVDGKEELTIEDYKIRDLLKKSKKEVIVVVNKLDNAKSYESIYDYFALGFPVVLGISGEHNRGFGELLEAIIDGFSPYVEEYAENILKFCLIGRPNVGKSSLINALLNEERVIVSDIPGTTRDAIDTKFSYEKNEYIAIDTAGMRKKGKIFESVEKYSLIRSMKAIDRSNVCVLVINADEGIIEHDKHIAGMAIELGKSIIIVVNKWDLIAEKNIKEWEKKIRNNFQFIPYANIVYLSALTKKRINTLMPEIIKAYENSQKEIKTNQLNDVITDAVLLHSPPSYKGKKLKIYFVSQTGIQPPKFTFNVNDKGLVHFSYERYLENVIRANFDLIGTPIILQFKNKNN